MDVHSWAHIIIAIFGGILIELFFQLVKYRDGLENNSPHNITVYKQVTNSSNYMTISEYLSGGNRKWLSYFLFRLLPPVFIFLLLAGVYAQYFEMRNISWLLILSALVAEIPRDLDGSILRARFISEKILHATNAMLVLLAAVIVSIIARFFNLSFIAPSISGLFDNLWSSLIIAILVLLYLRVTDMGDRNKWKDEIAKKNIHDNYIVKSYNVIHAKYDGVINGACLQNTCSRALLYSVLIYENMNRPAFLRKFENLFVRLTRLTLSVGIAQVQSQTPLTDEESIKVAAGILRDSQFIDSEKTLP